MLLFNVMWLTSYILWPDKIYFIRKRCSLNFCLQCMTSSQHGIMTSPHKMMKNIWMKVILKYQNSAIIKKKRYCKFSPRSCQAMEIAKQWSLDLILYIKLFEKDTTEAWMGVLMLPTIPLFGVSFQTQVLLWFDPIFI